jgi:hypothetical protein
MFINSNPMRTMRLCAGRAHRGKGACRPRASYLPTVEILEGRALPSATVFSLGISLVDTMVQAEVGPAPTVRVDFGFDQTTVSQASSAAATRDSDSQAGRMQDVSAAAPLAAFVVEVVFRETVAVPPAIGLTGQSTTAAVITVANMESTFTTTAVGPRNIGALPLSATAAETIAAAPSASGAVPVRQVTPSTAAINSAFGDLPITANATVAATASNFVSAASNSATPSSVPSSGNTAGIVGGRFIGDTSPADDDLDEDHVEPPTAPSMPTLPEQHAAREWEALSSAFVPAPMGAQDAVLAPSLALAESADPGTQPDSNSEEVREIAPEAAASVAAMAAGLVMVPIQLPTDTERQARRRRSEPVVIVH